MFNDITVNKICINTTRAFTIVVLVVTLIDIIVFTGIIIFTVFTVVVFVSICSINKSSSVKPKVFPLLRERQVSLVDRRDFLVVPVVLAVAIAFFLEELHAVAATEDVPAVAALEELRAVTTSSLLFDNLGNY